MPLQGRYIFLTLLFAASPVEADETCASLSARLARIDLRQAVDLATPDGKSYKSLFDQCDATDRFDGHELPVRAGRQMKCSTDKNRVAFLKRFPDRTLLFQAKMSVDADGSPVACSGNRSATDQCPTALNFDAGSTTRYVNSEEVSFIVLPSRDAATNTSFMRDSGVRLGDLAVAIKGDRCTFGVVGDSGPEYRLGEASLKAHLDMGNPQCARSGERPCLRLRNNGSGAGIRDGVTYLVFPGTRPQPLHSQSVSTVSAQAARLKLLEFLNAQRVAE